MGYEKKAFLEVTLQETYNESVISNLVRNVTRGVGAEDGDSIDFTKSVLPKGIFKLTKAQRDADANTESQKLVDVKDSLQLQDLYYKRIRVQADWYSFADYDWKNLIAVPSAKELAESRDALVTSTIVSSVDAEVVAVDPEDADAVLNHLRSVVRVAFTEAKAPRSGRYVAVSSDIYNTLLGHARFDDASRRGDTGLALSEATIGRVYGFVVFEDINLPEATMVAFDATAIFLGSAPLGAPEDDVQGTLVSEEGLTVGIQTGQSIEKLQHNVVVGTFLGAKVAIPERVKHYTFTA